MSIRVTAHFALFCAIAAALLVPGIHSAAAGRKGAQPPVKIEWSKITNPFLDTEPEVSVRDPLLVYHDGIFRCFYSGVEHKQGVFSFHMEAVESKDLVHWSKPKRLTTPDLGFSSPGNVMKRGDDWYLILQTYPTPPGAVNATEDARLWYMKSRDLVRWDEPVCLNPEGAKVNWSESKRQIDPCIVEHDGKYWCLYKTSGAFGLLVSDDFRNWREASPDRPVLRAEDTPGNNTVENPCVVRDGDDFVMIFAPCKKGRGIGLARSRDLLHWTNVHYLDFPEITWADNGPSAAADTDLRDVCGKWVMVFHGERKKVHSHAAALGIAWSDDLEHWTVPGK